MTKALLMERLCGETSLAVVEDGLLAEFYTERKGFEKMTGNIYSGRVQNVLPGMNAAFVDIGLEKNAFLYAGDIRLDAADQSLSNQLKGLDIRKLVRPGQTVLVQIVKEPGGTKGPRVSSNITLPGRYTVLLPTVHYVGISRRIEDQQERDRLFTIANGLAKDAPHGLIVRTAGEGVSEEEIRADFEMLLRLWAALSNKGQYTAAPALLHRDDSLAERAVRDMLTEDDATLVTDDKDTHARLLEAAATFAPGLKDRIILDEGETPLFVRHRVYPQLKKALDRRVWLKSGGYLVIDYTEALTVIDVNTGKFVGKNSLSDTILKTNLEAAQEIARQLRLRDIGGIIIVDFIDMDSPKEQETLLETFREALKADRTRTNLAGITNFGLVEMTRKKVRLPVHKQMTHICPVCQGSGLVLSHDFLAREILSLIRDKRRAGDKASYLIRASAAVSNVMLGLPVPEGGKTYVQPVEELADEAYEITPVSETALPSYVRLLKR